MCIIVGLLTDSRYGDVAHYASIDLNSSQLLGQCRTCTCINTITWTRPKKRTGAETRICINCRTMISTGTQSYSMYTTWKGPGFKT